VHAGFYDAPVAIIGDIAKAVHALNPSGALPVYVTGHSKGGAMASIAAYILQQGFGIKLQPLVTFASPRAGDSGFQAGYRPRVQ
jgi:putative lipase involved disintegration of autophagic bodies